MSWNYCPWCGHRVYQHSNHTPADSKPRAGCTHVDAITADGHRVDATGAITPVGMSRKPCDCTVPHSDLVNH